MAKSEMYDNNIVINENNLEVKVNDVDQYDAFLQCKGLNTEELTKKYTSGLPHMNEDNKTFSRQISSTKPTGCECCIVF